MAYLPPLSLSLGCTSVEPVDGTVPFTFQSGWPRESQSLTFQAHGTIGNLLSPKS